MINSYNKKQLAIFSALAFIAIVTGTIIVDRNIKLAEAKSKSSALPTPTELPTTTPNPTSVQPTEVPPATLMPELKYSPEVTKPWVKPSVNVREDDDEYEDD